MSEAERTAEYVAKIQIRLDDLVRAQRRVLTRCRKSGLVEGFSWPAPRRAHYRPGAFHPGAHRTPPLPFHAFKHLGPGFCRVCGQPIPGKDGKASRLTWHPDCVTVYNAMTKPNDIAGLLILKQKGICTVTGEPIGPPARPYVISADVDHKVPLFRVARDHATEPWFELLRFWLLGNLRAITHEAHLVKCRDEARERAGYARAEGQEAML